MSRFDGHFPRTLRPHRAPFRTFLLFLEWATRTAVSVRAAETTPVERTASEIDSEITRRLAEYLTAHHQSPEAYIDSKFRDRDIVTSTEFRRDRSPNSVQFSSAGNLVYNTVGDRAAEILLHQPPGDAKQHGPFIDAIHGAVSALPTGLQRGGFDTAGTSIGDLTATSKGYYRGRASGFTIADVHDGYVYLRPPSRFTPVTIIKDFVNAENIEEANSQAGLRKGRTYTADELNGMIPKDLKNRFGDQTRR